MSYEKQTWNKGDTITAEKLNHMEDGIAAVEKQQGPAGPAGADGQDGAAAEITEVTATVDASTGHAVRDSHAGRHGPGQDLRLRVQ